MASESTNLLEPNLAQDNAKFIEYQMSLQQQQQQQHQQQQQVQQVKKDAAETVINLDNDVKMLTNYDLDSIANLVVFDERGNRHPMCEIWTEFKTIFVFVRSFLCYTAKEYVDDLALIDRDILRKHQIRLVVIGCANWKHIKKFRQVTQFPYLMFCDVDYDIYNRLGFYKKRDFGRNGDSPHVKSGHFSGLLWSTMRAIKTSEPFDYQGDLNQQGGSMIVGPGPVLHFYHIDKHARDHCPINALLKQCGIEPIDFKKEAQKRATQSI